ncbi:MAG: hypothetical protein ACO1NU_05440 [Arcticibacter sp.]
MKPLLILFGVFGLALLFTRIFRGHYEFPLSGRIAMSGMLVFTAMGHFLFSEGMTMMLPPFISYKTEVVYLTGITEVVAAIGLLIPNFRRTTAWLLILFFILILPSNIYAAVNHVNYQKGSLDGPGLIYLWFRIPLQILFVVWTYISSIRNYEI